MDDDTLKRIIEMHRKGHTNVAIARRVGLHESTISRQLKVHRSARDYPIIRKFKGRDPKDVADDIVLHMLAALATGLMLYLVGWS